MPPPQGKAGSLDQEGTADVSPERTSMVVARPRDDHEAPVVLGDVSSFDSDFVDPEAVCNEVRLSIDLSDPKVILHQVRNKVAIQMNAISGIQKMISINVEDHPHSRDLLTLVEIMDDETVELTNLLKRVEKAIVSRYGTSVEQTSEFIKIHLSKVLKTKIKLWNRAFKSKNIVISSKIEEDVFINGDPVDFIEVLTNVLKNAIEMVIIQSNAPEIAVTLSSNESGIVRLLIQDNGPGIAPENMDKIFKPGFSTKNGQGIGLCLARRFVERMGGTLDLKNNRDRAELAEGTPGATVIMEFKRFEEQKIT